MARVPGPSRPIETWAWGSHRSCCAVLNFNQRGEVVYGLIWDCALEFNKHMRTLPSFRALHSLVYSRAGQFGLTTDNLTEATELLRWIYTTPESSYDVEFASAYLKTFLYDRTIGDIFSSVVDIRRYGTGVNYPALVQRFESFSRCIDKLQCTTDFTTIPDVWDMAAHPKIPTGVGFIDDLMHGGAHINDANVLLGATGVGKTLMLHQIAIAFAKQQFDIETHGGQPKFAAIVSYEDELSQLQIRAMSGAALVNAQRLQMMQHFHDLSTSDNLQPYEHKMYEKEDPELPRLGEQERIKAMKPILNRYMKLIDFSGGEKSMGGFGGISEVRAIIETAQDKAGIPIGYILLDWAGMAVRRNMRYAGRSVDKISLELVDYVQTIKDMVVSPLGAPALVAHQLRGLANRNSPTKLPDHTDAEWCSSFAVNAPYALVIGPKDREANACLFGVTKTRRGAGSAAVLCKINGDFCEMVPAGKELQIDPHTKRIVSRRDISQIKNNVASGRPVEEDDDSDFVGAD